MYKDSYSKPEESIEWDKVETIHDMVDQLNAAGFPSSVGHEFTVPLANALIRLHKKLEDPKYKMTKMVFFQSMLPEVLKSVSILNMVLKLEEKKDAE